MAITIDVTVSGEDSNSYITLAEASEYFEANNAFSTLWLALATDALRNARIVNAARAIDRYSFTSYQADYSTPQAMAFPRACDDTSKIPSKVKDAQAEMIIFQYTDIDSSTGQSSTSQTIQDVDVYQTVKIGYKENESVVVDKKQQASGGSIEAVEALLSQWMTGDSFEIVR